MQMKKFSKAIVASLCATAMMMPTVASIAPLTVSAGEVLGESTFTYKALPWHTCESSPAKQTFAIEDGAFHITVLVPLGGEQSKWDLQFRHRNLNFTKGHKYEVSFKVKSNRAGMELCSKIGNIGGDEEYFELNGQQGVMTMGPAMGGQWGNAMSLTTSYQEVSGTFTPTQDLKAAEWAFHYAEDHNGYGGNAKEGDELWFDDMHIVDKTGSDNDADPNASYGATNREFAKYASDDMTDSSGNTLNFISVNQVGYYPNLSKVAVLGDNSGDILHGATVISLTKDTYDFEIVNATSGKVEYTGTSAKKTKDADSGDNVCKLDFSDFTKEGRYYIRVGEWRSFEFNIGNNIYTDESHNMLTNSLNYFYQNRSGIAIESEYITSGDKKTLSRKAGHTTDEAYVQTEWVMEYLSSDEPSGKYKSSTLVANGGWYDAGDHGKYVVNGGISVWTLQNMYERAVAEGNGDKFADGSGTVVIPETGNKIPDILDECMWELDFMQEMVVKSTEPTWGKYAGLVYHKLHDHKWTGLATVPDNYAEEWGTVRIVKPPTYAATLNYVACAAQAARLLEPYDSAKAKEYLEGAKTSYEAFKKHFKEYDKSNPLYAPLDQAKGGGAYGDTEVKDDAYWAACELYITTGDSTYYDDLSTYSDAFKVTTRVSGGENDATYTTFNWGNTGSAGSLSLVLNMDNSKLTKLSSANKESLKSSVLAAADDYIKTENAQGYGVPYKYDGSGYTDPVNLPADVVIKGYEWGSNSMVINNAMVMAYAYDLTGEVDYMNGVTTAMDYLFGTNPLSFSYVTGYGTYCEKNPHHRYWSYELDDTLPMAPDGVLSGGPNAGLQDPYVRALGFVPGNATNPSQRCFVDSIEAWSTNEVTINWNSPLAWIVTFLQDEAATAGSVKPDDPDTDTITWGDANCDGKVTSADLVLFNKVLKDEATLSDQGAKNADVDHDGEAAAADIGKIMKYLAGVITYEDLAK